MTHRPDGPTAPLTVLLFGASGMVGQGVLRELLLDDRIGAVRAVVRRPLAHRHPKLEQVLVTDLAEPGDHLAGVDATFHSAGPSSVGMREPEYRRQTYDLTLAMGEAVAERSPDSVFIYVSGTGTDRDGRAMWARVKGETEDALTALPLRVWLFRPGFIQPLHGVRAANRLYRTVYRVLRPVSAVLLRVLPRHLTTTEAVGRAVVAAALRPTTDGVVTTAGINALASPRSSR